MAMSALDPILRAKLLMKMEVAEEAGRHDHVARFMMDIVTSVTPTFELTSTERKFLCASLAKIISDHRNAWHELRDKTCEWKGTAADIAGFYLCRIQKEILSLSREIKDMLGGRLLSSAQSAESKVLYLTLKGDVCCYISEVAGDEGAAAKAEALQTYSEAEALAKKELTWLSPARLILTYSFSRFHSEYRNSLERGVKIASEAVKNAGESSSNPTGELPQEMQELMSGLKNCIADWSNDEPQNKEAAPPPDPVKESGTSRTRALVPPTFMANTGSSGGQRAPPHQPFVCISTTWPSVAGLPVHSASQLQGCAPFPVPQPLPSQNENLPHGESSRQHFQSDEEPKAKRRKFRIT